MAIPRALRSPLLVVVAVLATLLLLPGAGLGQERPVIYKWVDQNGIAHYTTDPDRVPDELRGLTRELRRDHRAVAPEPAPPEPAQEDPWAAVSPSVEEDPWAVATEEPSSLWAVTDSASDLPAGPADDDDAFAATDPARKEALRQLEAQIAALEVEIARDEDRLKDWLTDPTIEADEAADDAEFRAIARRLPELHARMQELLEEKASVEGRAP
jgi:hypothetical protein